MEQVIHLARIEFWKLNLTNWLINEVLSPGWWALIVFLAITYIVWWKLLDKARIMEVILFGSLVSIMAAFTDIVGISTASWQYNVRLFPITVAVFPLDYSVIPIALMLAYQFTSKWTAYILASIVASVYYGVVTSVMEATGIISSYYWSPYWAFIEGMVYSFTARFALLWMKNLTLSYQSLEKQKFSVVPQPAMKPSNSPENKENSVIIVKEKR